MLNYKELKSKANENLNIIKDILNDGQINEDPNLLLEKESEPKVSI